MSAMENIVGVIKSPAETFRKILGSETRLIIPLDIIVATGFFGGVNSFIQRPRMLESFREFYSTLGTEVPPAIQEQLIQQTTIFDEVSSSVVSAIVTWVILVAVYYVISKLLRGKAGFKDLLELVGYARVPSLIGAIFGLMLVFVHPFLLIFFGLLFSLWSIALDVLAVRESNRFTTGKAIVTVAIPIVGGAAIMAAMTFMLMLF
ncbi:MAG: Yip1 family protein [Candidatus Hydrothermarchaeales archaeon]